MMRMIDCGKCRNIFSIFLAHYVMLLQACFMPILSTPRVFIKLSDFMYSYGCVI